MRNSTPVPIPQEPLDRLTRRAFQEILPTLGLPERPEQIRYADQVARAILTSTSRIPAPASAASPSPRQPAQVFPIEAGTGTGKTQGYLIPTLLHAALDGVKIGIFTHTLALQDQLMGTQLLEGKQPDFAAGDRSDMAVAVEVVRRLTGKTLRVAFRKGRQTYLDPDRALLELGDSPEDFGPDGKALAAWARSFPVPLPDDADEESRNQYRLQLSQDPFQGLISSWLEQQGGSLPPGISARDICLRDIADNNPWYPHHVSSLADADVIVSSHAMALFHLLHGRNLLPDCAILIHDEADTLESVAESYSRTRFRPSTLLRAMSQVRKLFGNTLPDELQPAWTTLEESARQALAILTELGREQEKKTQHQQDGEPMELLLVPDSPLLHQIQSLAADLLVAIQALLSVWEKSAFLTRVATIPRSRKQGGRELQGLLTVLQDATGVLQNFQPATRPARNQQESLLAEETADPATAASTRKGKQGKSWDLRAVGLTWSPKLRYGALESILLFPGRLYSQEWRFPSPATRLVLLTSATLRARVRSGGPEQDWWFFRETVGILGREAGDYPAIDVDRFGTLQGVVQVLGAPAPFLKEDETDEQEIETDQDAGYRKRKYHPLWQDAAVVAIQEMLQREEPGLLLTPSYRDIGWLSERFGDDRRVWLHHQDQRLADGVQAIQSGRALLLATPSAWAGANIRASQSRQPLLRHILILRLPNLPSDPLLEEALFQRNLRTFLDPQQARQSATAYMQLLRRAKSLHRFTQGFGRGIRAQDDVITLWVLDSRFPLSSRLLRQCPQWLPLAANERNNYWRNAIPERFRPVLDDPARVQCLVPDGTDHWKWEKANQLTAVHRLPLL